VWVSHGHAETGALVGSLIGIVVGVAVMSGKTCQLGDSGCINAGLAGFTGIMLSGTLLGAVIGGGTKSWQLRYP